jgi:hypothetical protein
MPKNTLRGFVAASAAQLTATGPTSTCVPNSFDTSMLMKPARWRQHDQTCQKYLIMHTRRRGRSRSGVASRWRGPAAGPPADWVSLWLRKPTRGSSNHKLCKSSGSSTFQSPRAGASATHLGCIQRRRGRSNRCRCPKGQWMNTCRYIDRHPGPAAARGRWRWLIPQPRRSRSASRCGRRRCC